MERFLQLLEGWYLHLDRRLGGRLTLLVQTGLAFGQDDGPALARSIAYFTLFSLFPMLLVLLTILSPLVTSDQARQAIVDWIARFAPGASDLVQQNIDQLLRTHSTVQVLALVGLVWSATGVFTAIYQAVNRAWGVRGARYFWTGRLYSLAVLVVAGLFLVAAIFVSTAVSVLEAGEIPLWGRQPFTQLQIGQFVGWLALLIPAVFSVALFTILYRTVPRAQVAWADVWPAGLAAGLALAALNRGIGWYLANFARYSLIYGSVGAIIALLLWSYLGGLILILGAELSAQYHRWRRAGRPVESRPLREWTAEWSTRKSGAATTG